MKKLMIIVALAVATLTAQAQRLLIVSSDGAHDRYLLSDIERITYEEDMEFTNDLLPYRIAADPKTQIFGEALKLTGIDKLIAKHESTIIPFGTDQSSRDSVYNGFMVPIPNGVQTFSKVKWCAEFPTKFTAFVETDEVLRQHGINNLDDLKAYAKRIYDEAYPDDASVSDPTARNNSLNRFVAYHLLSFCVDYDNLVSNKRIKDYYDRSKHDICTFYPTLMPYSTVKISDIDGRNFLNRRGLGSAATVEGVGVSTPTEMGELGMATNGRYYYLDDLLTYGTETQEQVLTDHWTVNFRSLSPMLMSIVPWNIFGMYNEDVGIALKGDVMDNIQADSKTILVYNPGTPYFNMLDCDAFYAVGDGEFTIKLPALPKGNWELRMGISVSQQRGVIQSYIDGVAQGIPIDQRVYPENYGSNYGVYHAPDYYFPAGGVSPLADMTWRVSYTMGSLHSDGQTDHYLRIKQVLEDPYTVSLIDYLEFVPLNK